MDGRRGVRMPEESPCLLGIYMFVICDGWILKVNGCNVIFSSLQAACQLGFLTMNMKTGKWHPPLSNLDGFGQLFVSRRGANGRIITGTDINCYNVSRIWIRIISTVSDNIRIDTNIINIQFEYSDMDMVWDTNYSSSNTNGFEHL